jgi:hypothetical protein
MPIIDGPDGVSCSSPASAQTARSNSARGSNRDLSRAFMRPDKQKGTALLQRPARPNGAILTDVLERASEFDNHMNDTDAHQERKYQQIAYRQNICCPKRWTCDLQIQLILWNDCDKRKQNAE